MLLTLEAISPGAAEALRRLLALGQGPLPCPVHVRRPVQPGAGTGPGADVRRVRRENVRAARPAGDVVIVRAEREASARAG